MNLDRRGGGPPAMSALVHPDRLFPAEEPVRSLARDALRRASATCRSSARTATPTRAGTPRTQPFPDPAQLLRRARPLRLPHAVLAGRAARRPRRAARRRRRRPRPTAARSGGRFAEHYHLLRGTPTRLWLDHTLRDAVRPRRAAVGRRPPTRTTTTSPSCLAATRVPAAGAVRALRHRGDRHHRERARRPALAPDDPRLRLERAASSPPTGPTRWSIPEFDGFAANVDRLGELTGCDTGDLGRLPRGAPRSAAPSSRRTAPPAPTTAIRPPDTENLPRGRGRGAVRPQALRGAGRRREEADCFRGQMLTEMARMSLDDGLVHADPPGLVPQPFARDAGALRPRQGLRHPDPHRLRARAEAAARRGRHASPTSPIILFTLDEIELCARAGAARRRLSGAAARAGLVVLRQPRGHAPLPRADHRDRRLLQHRRLQRRHPRLLLDPRPPRRGAAGRLRLPRPPRRRAAARARTRRTRSRTTSPTGSPSRPTGSDRQLSKGRNTT